MSVNNEQTITSKELIEKILKWHTDTRRRTLSSLEVSTTAGEPHEGFREFWEWLERDDEPVEQEKTQERLLWEFKREVRRHLESTGYTTNGTHKNPFTVSFTKEPSPRKPKDFYVADLPKDFGTIDPLAIASGLSKGYEKFAKELAHKKRMKDIRKGADATFEEKIEAWGAWQ